MVHHNSPIQMQIAWGQIPQFSDRPKYHIIHLLSNVQLYPHKLNPVVWLYILVVYNTYISCWFPSSHSLIEFPFHHISPRVPSLARWRLHCSCARIVHPTAGCKDTAMPRTAAPFRVGLRSPPEGYGHWWFGDGSKPWYPWWTPSHSWDLWMWITH